VQFASLIDVQRGDFNELTGKPRSLIGIQLRLQGSGAALRFSPRLPSKYYEKTSTDSNSGMREIMGVKKDRAKPIPDYIEYILFGSCPLLLLIGNVFLALTQARSSYASLFMLAGVLAIIAACRGSASVFSNDQLEITADRFSGRPEMIKASPIPPF
jgi:hypothetical protein